MAARVPFAKVIDFLESHGWTLIRIWNPYRVFGKPGHLPILVRVEGKTVDVDDYTRVQEIVRREAEQA